MRILKPCTLLLLLLPGCTPHRFVYEVDPAFRTTPYQTVAQDPRKDRVIIREGMRPLNPELHLQAALAELAARHYQPGPSPEADLWVATYVLMKSSPGNHGNATGAPHKEGGGEGHRGGGHGGTAAKGNSPVSSEGGSRSSFTIIVQLVDRKTGLPVWHGEATLDHRDKGADGGPLTIEDAVHQLLQPLPAHR